MQMSVQLAIKSNTRYELPPEGITLLGYVVRRMHKTALLSTAPAWVKAGQSAEALAQVALYAAGASASFGPAYYQPKFNSVGDVITQSDPDTGAVVTATLESRSPHYRIAYSVEMSDGSHFSGGEEITGTTVSLRGLGMPAPSRFSYREAGGVYTAQLTGLITSELIPGFIRRSRIRAHGTLDLRDNADNSGTLKLSRNGEALASIADATGVVILRRMQFASGD
jgi:hypothetical protein